MGGLFWVLDLRFLMLDVWSKRFKELPSLRTLREGLVRGREAISLILDVRC